MSAQDVAYREALVKAEEELRGLEESIRLRKERLQRSIASLKELLGDTPPVDAPKSPESSEEPDLKIWQRVQLWLNGRHMKFSVKDALAGLEQMGHPIDSPNRFQIMRQALKKKPTVFRHDPNDGTYQLILPGNQFLAQRQNA
jgi:hypothetical protein